MWGGWLDMSWRTVSMADSSAVRMDEKDSSRYDEENLNEQMADTAAQAVFEPSINMWSERGKKFRMELLFLLNIYLEI